jgi:enoyl-CoA hydratase/carnithine racemase
MPGSSATSSVHRRAAEQLAERIASERVNLNAQHFNQWGVVDRMLKVVAKRVHLDTRLRQLNAQLAARKPIRQLTAIR